MDRPPKDKSIERLQAALNAIDKLKQLPRSSLQLEKWLRDTEVAISNTFKDKPKYVKDFTAIGYNPPVFLRVCPIPTTKRPLCKAWDQRLR